MGCSTDVIGSHCTAGIHRPYTRSFWNVVAAHQRIFTPHATIFLLFLPLFSFSSCVSVLHSSFQLRPFSLVTFNWQAFCSSYNEINYFYPKLYTDMIDLRKTCYKSELTVMFTEMLAEHSQGKCLEFESGAVQALPEIEYHLSRIVHWYRILQSPLEIQ